MKDTVLEQIFTQLYQKKKLYKLEYYRLKIIELILTLLDLSIFDKNNKRIYYQKAYVEKVKEIKAYMDEHYHEKLLIGELAERFQISMTMLKKIFKDIYDTTIYNSLRETRIQNSKKLLLETNEKIIDIACKVGYTNASKYASAFKEITGLTPLIYRKIHRKKREELAKNNK